MLSPPNVFQRVNLMGTRHIMNQEWKANAGYLVPGAKLTVLSQ
ncbi:MAG: hypothetical protein ABI612_11935 [Betaproteobacteria bacterium]